VWAEGRALGVEDAITLARTSAAPVAPEHPAAISPLTEREQQVAALLAHGLTNRQIAAQLVVTERTVAAHVEHILAKLGFASRHQVGAWAAEHSLATRRRRRAIGSLPIFGHPGRLPMTGGGACA
jgi:DNA-binding NarL/FixJ family response regulator